mmetsp:Transcript_8463/g.17567  ORF Transcript_8463/g.17567 Transcript_8463/m.17567 type:complete len:238 (-) Transcript_8463:35-748(-)
MHCSCKSACPSSLPAGHHIIFLGGIRASCLPGGACLKDLRSKTMTTSAPEPTLTAGNTQPRTLLTVHSSRGSPFLKNLRFGTSPWPKATPMTSPAPSATAAPAAAAAAALAPWPDAMVAPAGGPTANWLSCASSRAPPSSPDTPMRHGPGPVPTWLTATSQYAASCSTCVSARATPCPETQRHPSPGRSVTLTSLPFVPTLTLVTASGSSYSCSSFAGRQHREPIGTELGVGRGLAS